MDLPEAGEIAKTFVVQLEKEGVSFLCISAAAHQGLQELIHVLAMKTMEGHLKGLDISSFRDEGERM